MSSAAVCVGENLVVSNAGLLAMAPWAVPRPAVDIKADSGGDGPLTSHTALPGKPLIGMWGSWHNDTPVTHTVLIRVTRASKRWVTSNPNAIQFRDRWTWAVDADPEEPVTSGIFNSQCGMAGDTGTNTVAEPATGLFYGWWPASSSDEWVGPLEPGETLTVRYRQYVWTPPPWSNNANQNAPKHFAYGGWARLQLIVFPRQGALVTG